MKIVEMQLEKCKKMQEDYEIAKKANSKKGEQLKQKNAVIRNKQEQLLSGRIYR